MEKDSCPLCKALPADWVDDPHERYRQAVQIIAALKDLAGGEPKGKTVHGKDVGQWRYKAQQWLLDEPE